MIILHAQTHIPRGPSGSVSRVAVGTGGGTVDVGGSYKVIIAHCISLMHAYNVYAYLLCFSLPPELLWEG